MAGIVCLANSPRPGGHCIAGIDLDSAQWVRPVSGFDHMAITSEMRLIDGQEPALLDILQIPLEDHGPDMGCQPENRLVKSGAWQKVGEMTPGDLLKYRRDDPVILHNHERFVSPDLFQDLPRSEWRSLQLVHHRHVSFQPDYWDKWRANFPDGQGYLLSLPVKDPAALAGLMAGQTVGPDCMLTVSLAGPWRLDEATPWRCYKLVAGVVQL